MAINLVKVIDPHSLRGYGLRPSGVSPHKLVIGGLSISSIANAMGGVAYKIGQISLKNTFCVSVGGCHYLYVSPTYKGYRRLAKLRFGQLHDKHDVDHALAKKLAPLVNCNYVVVALGHESPNRAHGQVEKLGVKPSLKLRLSKVIYPDERIFHKLLSRAPFVRQRKEVLKEGYDPNDQVQFGLSLKQQGIWNLAFGFHRDTPDSFLRRLK